MTAARRLAGTLAAALVAGGLAWLVGVPLRGSVMIALVAVGLVPILLFPLEDARVLPPAPPGVRHGARAELSRLSWAIGRRGRTDARVVRRLSATAYRRLGDLHLDPERPEHKDAAEAALGAWAVGVVSSDRTELTRREVVRLVDAIERLGLQRAEAVRQRSSASKRRSQS